MSPGFNHALIQSTCELVFQGTVQRARDGAKTAYETVSAWNMIRPHRSPKSATGTGLHVTKILIPAHLNNKERVLFYVAESQGLRQDPELAYVRAQ